MQRAAKPFVLVLLFRFTRASDEFMFRLHALVEEFSEADQRFTFDP